MDLFVGDAGNINDDVGNIAKGVGKLADALGKRNSGIQVKKYPAVSGLTSH